MFITAEFTESLKSILGEQRVTIGDRIGSEFKHDELPGGAEFMPDIVAEVSSCEEISSVLKLCHEAEIPVTVRGAGTGFAGGSVPVHGGIVLSMKSMNNILAFDDQAKTLTVQPGVLLQDVKAEAAKHGLYYPPDPGEKLASIGGNASTNASGPCAVKYGTTRDYIADAVIVLADGSVAKLSDKSEYAAAVGSEGILAVITELTLKLVEKPACETILLLPFLDMETCLNAAAKFADFSPAILEYLDTDLVEFSGKVTGNPVFPVEMDGERVAATLMISLEGGSEDELDEQLEAVAELAEEVECLDILVVDTPTLKQEVWTAYDAFHASVETAKSEKELNLSVPADQIGNLLAFAKALGDEKGLAVMSHAHVGSGGIHIHAISELPKEEAAPLLAELSEAVYSKCAELGGNISGEYGIGYSKKDLFKAAAADAYESLVSAKSALDPKGILNPGKVV